MTPSACARRLAIIVAVLPAVGASACVPVVDQDEDGETGMMNADTTGPVLESTSTGMLDTGGSSDGSADFTSDSASTAAAASTTDAGGTADDGATSDGSAAGTTGSDICASGGFPESLAAWEEFRDSNDNRYYYVGRRGVALSACFPLYCCLYDTLVVVEDGVVVRRQMTTMDVLPDDEVKCAPGWEEIGEDVGTMTAGAPAPVWTMDEVYDSCCEFVFHLDPEIWDPELHVGRDGLMRRCFGTGDSTIGPPEWGAEIAINEIVGGAPPN